MRIAGVITAFMVNAVAAAIATPELFFVVVSATLLIVVLLTGPSWIKAFTGWYEARAKWLDQKSKDTDDGVP